MSFVKISELPAASQANTTDELEANQAGTSRKVTAAQLRAGLAASGANGDITSLSALTTALSVAQGGTGATDAGAARTALGLGSIATQASNNVAITGGSVTGITDLAVADGGTGASDAAGARTNLLPSYSGNANRVLTVNSGATDVIWATAATSAVTSLTAGTGLTGGTITSTGTVAADIATDSNIRAGAASKLVAAAELYSAAAPVALTDGATITPNFQAARVFSVTLGGNRTLANPTNQTAGQSGIIIISQDGTGSRTLSYNNAWKFPGGAPSLTTTANAVDVISYYVQASGTIRATISKAFS